MWISLYHLGAIDNPSGAGARGVRAPPAPVHEDAVGQPGAGLQAGRGAEGDRRSQRLGARRSPDARHEAGAGRHALRILKVRLVERIAHLLGERRIVPVDMPLGRMAWQLAGMERDGPVPLWDLGDLDLLAKALGEKLREAGK
jgi:hypothetical protein